MTTNDRILSALYRFLAVREGARRFHHEAVAPGTGDLHRHCFGDFVARVWRRDTAGLEKHYGPEVIVRSAALTGATTGAYGGYLVPREFRADLYADVAEAAVVRPRATVVEMASGELVLPLPDATTAQASGTAAAFGGLLMKWQAEASARSETEPAWKQVVLTAHELTGYALASRQLLDDGLTLDEYLRKLFARSVAWYEDLAFLTGSGVGKPRGMLSVASTVSRNAGTNFKHVDAAAMIAKLLPSSWPRAVWVTHPTVLAKLVDIGSTTTTTWQANMPGDTSAAVGYLHGRPVLVSEKVSTLGTAGDVLLIDPLYYVIGDRGLEIARSDEEPTAFLKNQAAFRIVARVDGCPWFGGPVTLQDASSTVSPYVALS